MEERVRPGGTGLFMVELLASSGIFVLCAAVCIALFVKAETISRRSEALSRAVSAAQGAAESFRACGGDLAETAALAGGRVENGSLVIGYDADWAPAEGAGAYTLTLTPVPEDGWVDGELTVTGSEGELLRWQVGALEAAL